MKLHNGELIEDKDKIVVERILNDGKGSYQDKEYFIAIQEGDEITLYSYDGFKENIYSWELVIINAECVYKIDEFPDYVNECFYKLGINTL